MGNRECLHCGGDFEPKQKNSRYCSRKCNNAAAAGRYRKRSPEANTNAHLKCNYGITVDDRNDMYAEQDGECAICGTHMTLEPHKNHSACVDHCHTTGDVHSLLCNRCNNGLGHFGENPVILAKAIQYLAETGKVPTR